ncbi:DNA and RNA helicase [Paenibacillus amylolyticus]|uniref:DNA and RNA helicase n=1 Tax=Paenibacillus amylolyticus TaxID=1451 RepID=UPI000B89C9AF|nr:DNA and RNA helicase [Paenibacillus amylolyticus]
MFTYSYPHFNKGRILKTSMLEGLRDFPRDFIELYYRGYADGIVAGAEVEVFPDKLVVAPGMVLHKGRLYMLTEPMELAYQATGRVNVLKLRFTAEETVSDMTISQSELLLDEETTCTSSELELARFKLKEGARLRRDYQTFVDLATEFNTLHVIHVPYAAEGASTLSPIVMKDYAERLLRTGTSDPQDLVFAMMCLNEGTVARSVILHHIASRLGLEYREYDNAQIHRYLDRILANAGRGTGRSGIPVGGPHRMIVD